MSLKNGFVFALLGFAGGFAAAANQSSPPKAPPYEDRAQHDPNGIGKFYLGREIAHVMGHQAADWLERPERESEEKPELLLAALKLKPGDVVADIGAGTGFHSWRMAGQVGEKGLVYAVEIQQEMLDLLAGKMKQRGINNVKGVLGTITDPKLPANSVDLVLLVDVYHELDHPYEMMQAICKALKPAGRVVFVEFRAEDPKVPIKEVHKMSEAQVRKEMTVQPLEWVQTIGVLPWQHIIVFRKPRIPSIGLEFAPYELPEYEVDQRDSVSGLGGRWMTLRYTLKSGRTADRNEIRNRAVEALEKTGWKKGTLPSLNYVLSKIFETASDDLCYTHPARANDPPHWFYSQAVHVSRDAKVVVCYYEVGW